MIYQVTTALRKISGLHKKIWVIQGGQGAGKTISILLILIDYAFRNEDKEIIIASAELSKMKLTVIKDFLKILKDLELYEQDLWNTTSTQYTTPTGSTIKFLGLDKADIGKGLRSDVVFLNEANKTKFETYRELTSRAKRVILDFNPNFTFWAHTEVMTRDDAQFLTLTYKDNEFLSEEEKHEIERYYDLGYDDAGKIINEYWANKWRVYGLGEIGGVEGRIYNWKPIDYVDYLKIDRKPLICVDWGKVDPFAIVEMKYEDGNLYVHERNYLSENEWRKKLTSKEVKKITKGNDEGFVSWMFHKLAIPYDLDIVCDNNRPQKIFALRDNGWENAVAVKKWAIIDRVDLLQNINVYYTSTSKNIEYEQQNYHWKTDRQDNLTEYPEDIDNHTMDAIGYGITYLADLGVIRKL